MNTQETLERLVKAYEEVIQTHVGPLPHDAVNAYCLCVIARSLTR